MSVILTTPPPSYAFSADQISAKFTCSNYLEQQGIYSVNKITLANAAVTLKYGGKEIVMTPSGNPDDSGYQWNPANPLSFFQDNFYLGKDFNITIAGSQITLTAKKPGIGYDITGYNSTAGVAEVIKPNYSVSFRLFCENAENSEFELLLPEETNLDLLVGEKGMAEAMIGDKLHDHMLKDLRLMYPDTPNKNSIICKKSCRRYYFEYAERYGATPKVYKVHRSEIYTILQGGLSYIAQFNSTLQSLIAPGAAAADHFLKQGNSIVWTRSNQPQFLYFFNTRAAFNGAVEIKVYYTDSSVDSRTFYVQNFDSLRKYGFDLTYDAVVSSWADNNKTVEKYEVRMLDSAGAARSEVRTYYLNYEYRLYVRYFLFWSSFGTMDTRLCYGIGNSEFELFQSEAGRMLTRGYDIKHGNAHAYDLKGRSNFKIATGFMSKQELIANRDFYLSAFKYRFTKGLMLPIRVDSKTIPEITDGENLYAQQFDYSYQFDDHNFSEGDDEESGISSGDFFFNSGAVSNPTQGLIELDPTVPAWVKSITQADIDKWNSGNSNNSGNSGIDLSSYYTKNQIQNFFVGSASIIGYNRGNWDQAFTWGDHSKAGYITAVSGAAIFHPLENQRLSKGNDVVFNAMRASKVEIPGSPGNFWQISVDEAGTGGNGTAPGGSTGSSLYSELLDVALSGLTAGQIMVWSGSKWINQSASVDFSNFYTKTEIQNYFSGATGMTGYNKSSWDSAASWGNHASAGYLKSVSWSDVSNRPTNLSDFNNNLGNYGNWITAAQGNLLYQPLENQRLSTGNNVVFNAMRASKVEIPGSAGNFWQIYVDEAGLGGNGSSPGGGSGSSLYSQLLDVALSGLTAGQVPVWNGTKWVNQNIVTDFSNYYTKSASDQTFLKIAFNSASPQNANFAIGYANERNFIQSHAGKALDINPLGNDITFNGKGLGTAAFKNISYTGEPETVAMRNGSGHIWASYFNTIASVESGGMGAIMGLNGSDGFLRPFNYDSVRGFLGLGTFALKSTVYGSDINTDIGVSSSDIGVARYLRWKNYGSSHVIFDASQGTAPNGVAIDRVQAQINWSATYPTLMGWNGAATYGVRVDSARLADSATLWGTQTYNANDIGPAINTYIMAYGSDGQWHPATQGTVRNWLGQVGAVANSLVQRDSNGYINNTYFNSSRGDETINAASYLFDTGDGYMRKKPVAWAAGELTGVSRHWSLRNDSDGVAYHNGTLELINSVTRPSLGFHHAGVVASSITIERSGRIAIMNNPGTDYENFIAKNLYAVNDVSANYTYGQIFVAGTRVYSGWDSTLAGSISCNNWFRTTGPTGLYFDTYQGGIYMFDDVWVRTYGSKKFFCDNEIRSPIIRPTSTLYIPARSGADWTFSIED
jgi:hypothetical protein